MHDPHGRRPPHECGVEELVERTLNLVGVEAVQVQRGRIAKFGGENRGFRRFSHIQAYASMVIDMNKRLVSFLVTLICTAILGVGLIVTDKTAPTSGVETAPLPQHIETPTSTSEVAPSSTVQTNASVVRVVDGDTFVAKEDGVSDDVTIRMLGINTPETVDPRKPVECFGKEASAKLKELLTGKRIKLVPDPQADERDKYHRLLRNVLLEDGTDVNAFMVREGYAYAYLTFPLNRDRREELRTLEELARSTKSGVWSPSTCATTL
jgi:micrococcal nuclease